MKIKTNKGLKVTIIAVVLLLCLALAIGITGAFYQAKRQATGTLSMDQGIIIDYKGFGKTPNEGIWSRENKTTFLLFGETNAQPGEQIAVNAAGIRANEKSVNFYARVKLSYKFYNVSGETETEVTLANTNDLITTSGNFFGTNWVEFGDGYFYYATGSTLNKFEKGTQTFVDLFATDAKFIIEGAGFTGANNNGEGGGFVDGTTSINKIEVYLTLETLQGDATAEQAKELGWKIAQTVDFSKVDEGKIVTSAKGELVDEKLNVTINGNQTKLEEVKFPYGEETVLEFDSKNVEYVELKYSDNTTERFYELEASENSATKNSQIQVLADESHGTVKGYTIGWFSSNEYTGFLYSNNTTYEDKDQDILLTKPMDSGICVTGYVGNETEITIPSSVRVRERDFKLVLKEYSTSEEFFNLMASFVYVLKYPCVLNGTTTLNSLQDLYSIVDSIDNMTDEEFIAAYPKMEFEFKTLCVTSSILYSEQDVKEIDYGAFQGKTSLLSVTIPDNVTSIGKYAFNGCSSLTSVTIGNAVESIGQRAFTYCSSLTSVTIGSGVTSIGNEAFYNCTMLNKVNITDIAKWCEINFEDDRDNPLYYAHNLYLNNELITELIIPDGVTSIGNYAFTDCTSLTSVIIGNAVESIGQRAFTCCSSLTSVTIGNSVTSIGNHAFIGCDSLTSIIIPDSVTNIGDGAFSGCSGLTSVTMGNSVKRIGDYAFNSCKTLESITIPNSVTYINNNTFNGCSSLTSITIPDSVTQIGQSAFSGCSGLTSVTIGSGVTLIRDNAFCDCSGLKTITIPNGVKSIEPFTFDGCSSLTSITIPDSVKSIGRRAFLDCISLTSITIPNSVISIGESAFDGCKGLTSITIPDSVTSIGEGAFGYCRSLEKIEAAQGNTKYSSVDSKGNQVNCLIDKDTNTLIAGCKNSVIPADGSVTSIGSWAFYGCSGLKTITIPNNVTSIGNRAFSDCRLKSITIPDSVTSIGNDAFFNCHNLTTTIGDGWVKVRDNTSVAASTFLRDIYYDIRRA